MVKTDNYFYGIPIFIISYNRTETLRLCLERFLKDGYRNIIIVDNASTNQKHLRYLKGVISDRVKVHFLDKNYGHHVVWECGLFNDLVKSEYYVVTDPDILPLEECPSDYVEKFYEVLRKFPEKTKVGFALKIDDLPEDYRFKYDILRAESFYWENCIAYGDFRIYDAELDTTFALYRPGMQKNNSVFYRAIRFGAPYVARHLGWYPNDYGQKEYYAQVVKFSTSDSVQAMRGARYSVIRQLAAKDGADFYKLLKIICTVDFVEKYVGFGDTLKAFSYVMVKK